MMNPASYRSGARERTFVFSELVSAYYYPSAMPDNPYEGINHGFAQLYLVLDGEGYFQIDGVRYPVSSGMMIYVKPDTEFSYWWENRRAEYALISFVCASDAMRLFDSGGILLCEEERKILMDTIRTTAHICDYSKIKRPPRIEIYVKPDTPDVVIDYIYASLERFLSLVYCRLVGIDIVMNESQKVGKRIEESFLIKGVEEYLKAHVEEQIRIDELCKCFGISPTSLMEKFRKETNKTVIEYFNEQKIGRAKDLIRNSAMSFTEISEALGFSSLNYFSKLFKAKTGMTLTDFSRLASKRKIL